MFCGYYRKNPYYRLGLGPIGGYQGTFAPNWMYERAMWAAMNCEPFNCKYPCKRYCGCCGQNFCRQGWCR